MDPQTQVGEPPPSEPRRQPTVVQLARALAQADELAADGKRLIRSGDPRGWTVLQIAIEGRRQAKQALLELLGDHP